MTECPECVYPEPPLWSDQPMNETIREYAKKYVSPVIVYYPTLDEALDEWGENFERED